MTKTKQFFIAILAVAVLVPVFAFGATMQVGEEVFIKKGSDIKDNAYFAGGNISVNSVVFGDLLVAGGNVLISNDVSEDIAVVGGSITILGNAGGDIRVAGGDVLITGDVVGDLLVAGGSVIISADTSVGGDLIIAGGQVNIDGNIDGDVKLAGGVVIINGYIKGDIKAEIDEKLTIASGAVILGNLEYKIDKEESVIISERAVVAGEIIFKERLVDMGGAKSFLFTILGAFVIFKLVSVIIIALILVWLFRKLSNSVVRNTISNPLKMIGLGFAVLVLMPIASMILFMTLFGVPLGIILLLMYGVLLILTCVYGGIVVGAWLDKTARKSDNIVITWKNVVVGIILLTFIKLIPFIGWIIGFAVFLMTLGGIINSMYKKIWKQN